MPQSLVKLQKLKIIQYKSAIALLENDLQETRRPEARIGIRIGAQARDIQLAGNQTKGFAIPVSDLRTP